MLILLVVTVSLNQRNHQLHNVILIIHILVDDSMYVFGGFTSSFSSFNDLWKFDLSARTWTRIGVQGKCPVPKAGATMVTYEDKLILFGGLLPPTYGMLYQV